MGGGGERWVRMSLVASSIQELRRISAQDRLFNLGSGALRHAARSRVTRIIREGTYVVRSTAMSLVSAPRSAAEPKGSSRPYTRQNKLRKHSVDAYINEGLRMEAHMRIRDGTEATADIMQQAAGAMCGKRMPYRFYPMYCDEVLECKFTNGKREYLRRALKFYAMSIST